MEGGHSKEKTQDRPLSASERAAIFNSQLALIGSALSGQTTPIAGAGGGYTTAAGGGFTDISDPGFRGGGGATYLAGGTEKALFGDPVRPGEGLGVADPYQASQLFNAPQYVAPEFASFEGGDFGRLEEAIRTSRFAPLERIQELERERAEQSITERGLYTSGLAEEAQQEVTERFLPQFAAAGAEATTARFGLEAEDIAARNVFQAEQAAREYESRWAPLRYLQELYGATGGQVGATNVFEQRAGF
jgi:hypothetical protein